MKYFIAILMALALCASAGTDPLPTWQGAPVLTVAGTPTNGTSAIQTLTFGATITSGTFKLAYKGKTSAAITWTATDATLVSRIDAALEALGTVGTGGVVTAAGTISSGVNGTITVTMGGNSAKLLVDAITVADNSLVGAAHTLTCTITTAGVTADGRTAALGQLLVDTTGKRLYQNFGTSLNPDWTPVISGNQTTITGDGAVAVATGTTILTKGSAAAITIAAPTSATPAGTRVTILSNSDFAHVTTFASTSLLDGTTGANSTATFAAFKGASITVIAVGTKWLVESFNACTIAP